MDFQNSEKFINMFAKKGDLDTQINGFEIKGFIGKGKYGKVFLVSKKDTSEVFAMKV